MDPLIAGKTPSGRVRERRKSRATERRRTKVVGASGPGSGRPRRSRARCARSPVGHRVVPDHQRWLPAAAALASFGEVDAVGVERTGAWGAGLHRFLTANGVRVVEVMRPNRQRRRRYGKSDVADAISATRAVQAGEAVGTPKTATATVEAIRLLRIASAQDGATPRDPLSRVSPDIRSAIDAERRSYVLSRGFGAGVSGRPVMGHSGEGRLL